MNIVELKQTEVSTISGGFFAGACAVGSGIAFTTWAVMQFGLPKDVNYYSIYGFNINTWLLAGAQRLPLVATGPEGGITKAIKGGTVLRVFMANVAALTATVLANYLA